MRARLLLILPLVVWTSGCSALLIGPMVCDSDAHCRSDEQCSPRGFCEERTDVGDPVVDAGTPVVDAGTPSDVDAGRAFDAGRLPVVDAGNANDAGAPPNVDDAGPPVVVDAGNPVVDAGPLQCAPQASYFVQMRVDDPATVVDLCPGAVHTFETPPNSLSAVLVDSSVTITPTSNENYAFTVEMHDPDSGERLAISSFIVEVYPADWWEFVYQRRLELTFPRAGSDVLVRLPVHVVLDHSTFQLPLDPTELRFAQALDQLPAEVMQHDSTSSRLWLSVDRFGDGQDPVYLYFNPANTNLPPELAATEVWSDYSLVLHLGDSLNNSVTDTPVAVTNGNGSSFNTAPGVFGNQFADRNLGAEFEVVLPTGTFNGEITTTMWGRFESTASDVPILEVLGNTACNGVPLFDLTMRPGFLQGNVRLVSSISSPNGGQVGPGHDPGIAEFWGGGATTFGPEVFVLFGRSIFRNSITSDPNLSAARCIRVSSLVPRFLGELDEVRVSPTLRSMSFVDAERLSAEDGFVAQGEVQPAFP